MKAESLWVGTEEYGGLPTPERRGSPLPPHWRLEAVWATERPRTPSISADGRLVTFIQDRDTSDVWLLELEDGSVSRLTTGRQPMPYWEDTTPVVSPDGAQIAFADEGKVWVVAAAGGPAREVAEAGSPVWLGHDRLVVSVERETRSRLAVVSLDDPWPQPLVRAAPGLDTNGDEQGAVVSPDGSDRRVPLPLPHGPDPLGDPRRRRRDRRGARADGRRGDRGGRARVVAGRTYRWRSPRSEASGGSCARSTLDTGSERVLASVEADFSEPAWSSGRSADRGCSLEGVQPRPRARRRVHRRGDGHRSGRLLRHAPLGKRTARSSSRTRIMRHRPSSSRLRDSRARAPRRRRAGRGSSAPRTSFRRRSRSRRPTGSRSTHSSTGRARADRPAPGRRLSARRAEGVLRATSGTGVAQYFVDKGYAWLSLNYRGSTGRGKAFEHLNDGDWGGGDTQDCLAAADYLRTLDWVDGERLAIFGASYGSYMALSAVVEDAGERFRCAVCKYGDCDLVTTWAQGDWVGDPVLR